jgi:Tol biopolymer transport system component
VLRKGHARPTASVLMLALAISLAATYVEAVWAALPGDSSVRFDMLGRPSYHVYVGHSLPALPRQVGPAQATPNPDTNLTPTGLASVEQDPDAAPAGTTNRVIFSSNGVDADSNFQIDPTLPTTPGFVANFNIWEMRPDGSEQRQITSLTGDEIQPAYSPSGSFIAYAGNQTGRWEIYVYNILTKASTIITDGEPGEKLHPTWSGDGQWIAYQGNAAGNWDIYKIPANKASGAVRLTTNAADDTTPSWAPQSNGLSSSGSAIAFVSLSSGVCRICWVDAESPDAVEILSDGGTDATANDCDPAWSKDAQELAFASDRTPAVGAKAYNIWRMADTGETSGGAATQVTNTAAINCQDTRHPCWSAAEVRQPQRFYYDAAPTSGAPTQRDVWMTLTSDTEPPVLGLTGSTRFPVSMDQRLVTPGTNAVIHAEVYDAASGVRQVFVLIKDPDQKQFGPAGGRIWSGNYQWNTGFDGYQYEEWTFQTVAAVEMFDDGDPANGDAVAGDGVFSCAWQVPLGAAHDWILDVGVVDNAGNTQNYDNIYGFSSKPFTPSGNVLFVNDYCEGQQFIYERSSFDSMNLTSAYNTESYYLSNPSYSPQALGTINYDTIRNAHTDIFGGTETVDVWRVICRGTVPGAILDYYLPSIEYQLDPVEAATNPDTAAPTRAVQLSRRTVIWASPHAGGLWVADGSIIDSDVQATVGAYLDKGGRLLMSGSDIAWALTLNGKISNAFLSNYLHATFGSDYPSGYASGTRDPAYSFTVSSNTNDPVGFDPWGAAGRHYLWGGHTNEDSPLQLETPRSYLDGADVRTPTYEDASDWSYRPDVIGIDPMWTADANTRVTYTYGGGGGGAAVSYTNTTSSAKVVYLGFGLESIHRGYHSHSIYGSANSIPHCNNRRSHLIHNFICWSSTGSIQGKVLSVSDGMKPVTGPNTVVLIYRGAHVVGDRSRPADFAVRCQDDGSYVVNGLPPGSYSLDATRPGYEIAHDPGGSWLIHGGGQPAVLDMTIARARPGAIAGTVTSAATTLPLSQVVVRAWAVPSTYTGAAEPDWASLGTPAGTSAATGADGAYTIGSLPEGDYFVRADGAAAGYGTQWARVTVTSATTTTQDFALTAADGTLQVTVVTTGTGGPVPIEGAIVTATNASGTVTKSGTTDATGVASIALQPGSYTITVTAAGYQTATGTPPPIVSSTVTPLTVVLSAEAPGSITGRVLSATTSQPKGGITVEIYSGTLRLGSTVTTGTLTTPTDGTGAYNFRFASVPTGTITVKVVADGFTVTPAQRTVTVASNAVTANVTFSISSLHTFPAALQLISLPYDYSGRDPKDLLGVSGTLLMATWESYSPDPTDPYTVVGRYRLYPNAPADRFRLGRGYWMRLSSPSDLGEQGLSATGTVAIELMPGWNLIGDPFASLVDFYSAMVQEESTGIQHTVQSALSSGLLEGGMFAYVLGGYQNTSVFSPWVGTWLRASERCSLLVTPTAGSLAVKERGVPTPEGGWLASLEVSANGMTDQATHFGAGTRATGGYDKGLDMPKPPAPDFAPYVYASLAHNDWESRSGGYAVDVVSTRDRAPHWTLQVMTNQTDAEVTVRWPNLSALPASVRPILSDPVTGKSVYMRTAASYTFRATEAPRELTISLAGSGAAYGLSVSAASARQFGPADVRVAYSLSRAAQVDVEVMNMAGRVVRQVQAGAAADAGAQTTRWDGRSAAGTRVAAGRYLVRITARAEDGQQTQVVVPVQVGR